MKKLLLGRTLDLGEIFLVLTVRYISVFLFFLLSFPARFLPDYQAYHLSGAAQGTTYHITYYAKDSAVSVQQIDSILTKIDSSLSIYKPWSMISHFNAAVEKIKMDDHFNTVLKRAQEISADSKGIFDITVFPLVQAWGFGVEKADSLPGNLTIDNIKQCVDYRFLKVKDGFLYKSKPCVKLDMNGIAQGYSVDVIAAFLEANGINNYLVELGGEIRVKGKKTPANDPISIGIEAPSENEFAGNGLEKIITADHGALTTSGSYRKFRESNGKKISHIIDPRTGYPSINELISVTIYAKDAITADGYDNTLMVMGLEEAIRFTEARKDMAAYFIYRKNDGTITDTASSRFYDLVKPIK